MSEIDKVLLKLEQRKQLLDDLIKLEIEREQMIASYFPGFAVTDKKIISEEVEHKFFKELERDIEIAFRKDLDKVFS
tara:strand:- start:562 stop:792 length:231 start_codon:yes stop_codon:yes gene_type:complete